MANQTLSSAPKLGAICTSAMAGGSQLRDAVWFHGDFEASPSLIAGACVYVGNSDTKCQGDWS